MLCQSFVEIEFCAEKNVKENIKKKSIKKRDSRNDYFSRIPINRTYRNRYGVPLFSIV
jgi:hypothetical protein